MPKANMLIIRGLRGKQFTSESFERVQHHAYTKLTPLRVGNRGESIFQLVLLVPGQEPVRTEVEFFRLCNVLSMAPEIAALIPPEFRDPLEAIRYAAENGLETPPFIDLDRL
jgi:hypothetical protein